MNWLPFPVKKICWNMFGNENKRGLEHHGGQVAGSEQKEKPVRAWQPV
jgi:hypothetical protein